MALTIFLIMIVLLLLGFPMMIPLLVATFVGFLFMFGDIGKMDFMVQQMIAGIRPASLIAVPMFILAADIMTRGLEEGVRAGRPEPVEIRRPRLADGVVRLLLPPAPAIEDHQHHGLRAGHGRDLRARVQAEARG